jgi:hypothetical protein
MQFIKNIFSIFIKTFRKVINGVLILVVMYALTACVGIDNTYSNYASSPVKKVETKSLKLRTSFANSEKVRAEFFAMPNTLTAQSVAMVNYHEPDDTYATGMIVGYLKACNSVSNTDHSRIIFNHLEMIELHSTDFSLYKNGVPNEMLIKKRKGIFHDGLEEGEKAARSIKRTIQRDFCGETLKTMRKSIWDWAQ